MSYNIIQPMNRSADYVDGFRDACHFVGIQPVSSSQPVENSRPELLDTSGLQLLAQAAEQKVSELSGRLHRPESLEGEKKLSRGSTRGSPEDCQNIYNKIFKHKQELEHSGVLSADQCQEIVKKVQEKYKDKGYPQIIKQEGVAFEKKRENWKILKFTLTEKVIVEAFGLHKVKSKMLCKFNPLAFYLLFTNF